MCKAIARVVWGHAPQESFKKEHSGNVPEVYFELFRITDRQQQATPVCVHSVRLFWCSMGLAFALKISQLQARKLGGKRVKSHSWRTACLVEVRVNTQKAGVFR